VEVGLVSATPALVDESEQADVLQGLKLRKRPVAVRSVFSF
jgi:hypothetical protein